MRMYDLIIKKRNGEELSTEEINYFIEKYTSGDVEDYQASALLMAIFFKKMNMRETVDLTTAMMHSGDVIDLSDIEGIKVDKHSTGGVGDTTTLVLAPLIASCGVPVAKMSGRGLGHTGGTLDKLEAIKEFKIGLTIDEFTNNVNKNKIAVVGQTKNIAPADKKLYALRDVTGTVDNISLIASSIMSKKLAAGADAIVLDVKVGSGAFIHDIEGAKELSKTMVEIGSLMGRNTIALITDMDQPLGYAIGNSLEVIEAINTLKNKGPKDLTELCLNLGGKMLLLAGRVKTFEEGEKLLIEKIESGEAFNKFKEFVSIQGGDISVIENIDLLPKSENIYEVKSDVDGYIEKMVADEIGICAMMLGAGRETKESDIDLSAGILIRKKVGDEVKKGDTLAVFHTNKNEKVIKSVEERFFNNITISKNKVEEKKLIKAVVTIDGVEEF
ncbi:pyrimidine-nucleoside phosphorylase [Clostridiaceae bacterium HSG29]|nr:pyrimidine-nucleoside phosphorylase [Clostridiaceae bacterium HSG29]